MSARSATTSATKDGYSWIGASGGAWGLAADWKDTTTNASPALFQPGLLTPVTIAGPAGPAIEVISGGGTAASLAVTGMISLAGSYAVSGAVNIGSQAAGPTGTPTAGALSLNTGNFAAGTVNIINGGFTVGAGARLSTIGGLSTSAGAFTDAGGLVSIGSTLSMGTATTTPMASSLTVTGGGTVAVAGALTTFGGGVFVTGAGSTLKAGGTFTVADTNGPIHLNNPIYTYGASLLIGEGGAAQFDEVVLNTTAYSTDIFVDDTSKIEIGTAGDAAIGALTIDADRAIIDNASRTTFFSSLVDNGTLAITSGTLTQNGPTYYDGLSNSVPQVLGTGVIQIGKNATWIVNCGVAATNTIAFVGTGAALSIGSYPGGYNSTTLSSLVPYAIGATITGFQAGDSIVLAEDVTTASYTAGTGASPGTLVLSNGTTTLETLRLAGNFTGKNFFISPTAQGGSAISLVNQTTLGSAAKSATADAYSWTGASGGAWNLSANWKDVITNATPALFQPGTLTPVTIAGSAGSVIAPISGGGAAASLAVTGTISLAGSYAVSGAVTIGSPAVGSTGMQTAGKLSLNTGTISAGTVNIIDGDINVGTGARLSTIGALSLSDNELEDAGGLVSIGSTLSIGTLITLPIPAAFAYLTTYQVEVTDGGTLAVAGAITAINGDVLVTGTGAKLTASGTLTTGNISKQILGVTGTYSGSLSALTGGSAELGGVVLNTTTYLEFITVDRASKIEIGTAGVAAVGAITIDAGKAIIDNATQTTFAGSLVDNGTLAITSGTLTQNGFDFFDNFSPAIAQVSGTGVVQIGKNATWIVNCGVAATDTIAFVGTGAALSIGSSDGSYNYTTYTGHPSTPYAIGATITGFQAGDTIFLAQAVTTASYTAGTGANPGTLVLSDGTATLETIRLAGTFTGKNFFVSPTTQGGSAITLVNQTTLGSAAKSATAHAYSWTGASGGAWNLAGNWNDATTNASPALFQPGLLTPVTIAGPTGPAIEVISGGGAAASLAVTGTISLAGSYAVSGAVTIGSPAVGPTGTLTAGGLSLNTGTITAGTVNIIGGGITVAAGAKLATSGGLSISTGTFADAGGLVSIGSTLSIGTATTPPVPDPFGKPITDQVAVTDGGTLAVAGAITVLNGGVFVTGSELTATGTLTVAGIPSMFTDNYFPFSGGLAVVDGACAQLGGIVLNTMTYGANVSVGFNSELEIGTTGRAAVGAITIDAGKVIIDNATEATFAVGSLVNNGTLVITRGTLTQNGCVYLTRNGYVYGDTDSSQIPGSSQITGSGIIQIGNNATWIVNCGVAATDTIAFVGTGAALSIGTGSASFNYATNNPSAPYTVGATITGFQVRDSIILRDAVTTATYTAGTGASLGTLVLSNGTTTLESLHLAGNFTGKNFFISPTTEGGSAISLIDHIMLGSAASDLITPPHTTI